MNKKVLQRLESMITALSDYEVVSFPLSALDRRREILEVNHEGITEQFSKKERLITVRKGKLCEIEIAKRTETRFDYGDFRQNVEEGEPIQNHLHGDEEAVIIVRSEFSTKPKGPHLSTKVIEIFE